ncbi:hypothetical protein LCGC14_0867660 [marine sediment metagenome]|uniref:SpoVT-AbrB domain-containing protein n=1 Tax=marine sediment metagenome TaxID=412755 RepID=A0A0F9SCN2_9ZZZZ|nr:hypothetical protein [Desulfobacterales bacterium]
MISKIVRITNSGYQFRLTIPREIAIESGLYMAEFVEIKIIEEGILEVKKIELEKARKKGIPADKS